MRSRISKHAMLREFRQAFPVVNMDLADLVRSRVQGWLRRRIRVWRREQMGNKVKQRPA